MNIELNDKYRVTADSRQFNLQKFTGRYDDEGNEVRQTIGHYALMENLVKAIIEKEIKTSKLDDLQQITVHIEKLRDEIVEKLEETQ